MDNEVLLKSVGKWQRESENIRTKYDARWQKNIKLTKGVPLEDKTTVSTVRNRHKTYFRKIWATLWRLVASFYAAFLRDPESFLIEGRDTGGDPVKAKFLQILTRYRIDKLNRTKNLFVKHIWAIMNMLQLGIVYGKLAWEYDEELGKDGPVYTIYPNEQVYPDFTAETSDEMRYVIFENFLTGEELEERGYQNLDEAEAEGIPANQVRSARYQSATDVMQNPKDSEYPKAGTYEDNSRDEFRAGIFRVWECFYKEKGKIKFCITNRDKVFFKEPTGSPYGEMYPLVMGTCITEPHKLIGEGLPEPLEGPQESYNYNLNMRKDNIALQLTPPTVISRFGNVDLNALVNRKAGGVVQADDPNAVVFTQIPDATRSAYADAAADDYMMQEMSGVTPTQNGMGQSETATGDQINLSQGNAKIELYLAIGGETYFRSFYSLLVYLIQKFETDENIFRLANVEMKRMGYEGQDIHQVDDFDADVIINIGMAYAGREQEIRQTLLVLDRGAVYNANQAQLLQMGAVPPTGVEMFNGNQLFRDLLPKLGKKELDRYFITVLPPPAPPTASDSISEYMAGKTAPQVGDMGPMSPENNFQGGSTGGY